MVPRAALCSLVFSILLLACGRTAAAQQFSTSATIGVSLRVLPSASFEGGATHSIAAMVTPGERVVVAPASGVRTRMTYNADTRVRVTATPLRGPRGASVTAVLQCEIGVTNSIVPTSTFSCDEGFVATLADSRTSSVPLAVGATLPASATRQLPAGLYVGQVTLVATNPGY